jgi:hypothetical protein
MFAVWNPVSSSNPAGLVQLNLNHPVFVEECHHWVALYPPHLEEEIVQVIKDVYAELAVATVAHSESLRRHLERKSDIEKLRTPEALTTGLLGLVGASAILGPRLGGAFGRRRQVSEDVEPR